MKTNCRNCKWAEWSKSETGRRQFGIAAECTYKVIAIIPASRVPVSMSLSKKVNVHSYDNIAMACAAWEERLKETIPDGLP